MKSGAYNNSMNIGDLITDLQWPEDGIGVILNIIDRRKKEPYLVLCTDGKSHWFSKNYIERGCEVISEGR
jgi:hypothetical protein